MWLKVGLYFSHISDDVLPDIFDNFTSVDIESVGKLFIKHIFSKAEIVLVRGTELLSDSGKLLAAQIQRFDKPDDLVLVGIFYDTAVFLLALDVVVYPYQSF